jgi:hypothetical protein
VLPGTRLRRRGRSRDARTVYPGEDTACVDSTRIRASCRFSLGEVPPPSYAVPWGHGFQGAGRVHGRGRIS